LQRLYARLVVSNANSVVAISSYYGASDKLIIPYGVDVSEFSPARRSTTLRQDLGVRASDVLLLTVQRLAAIKRVDILLRVVARVVARNPNVVLVVGGQGPEERLLESISRQLGIQGHVRFLGYIPRADLPRHFASADIFVFHSLMETFGIVFAQAMASGLPIVAANTSCVPDVVHRQNGALVPPFDLDAFADAVVKLAADRALRRSIGARNRARAVEEFDWDKIAAAYEAVLTEVAFLPRRGAPGR
jgi:glycosyltransferase involved in cell wall biosynthesis